MSEITEIVTNLRGWERDIISGTDALNISGQAILEKRHVLDRAALEIEALRARITLIQRVNENLETVRAETAQQCYQIAQSHEFGFEAAKTIREEFGLEI